MHPRRVHVFQRPGHAIDLKSRGQSIGWHAVAAWEHFLIKTFPTPKITKTWRFIRKNAVLCALSILLGKIARRPKFQSGLPGFSQFALFASAPRAVTHFVYGTFLSKLVGASSSTTRPEKHRKNVFFGNLVAVQRVTRDLQPPVKPPPAHSATSGSMGISWKALMNESNAL